MRATTWWIPYGILRMPQEAQKSPEDSAAITAALSPCAGKRRGRHRLSTKGRRVEGARSECDDGFDLIAVEPFEPLHDVVDVGACSQIVKDDGDGHARAFKHPGAA